MRRGRHARSGDRGRGGKRVAAARRHRKAAAPMGDAQLYVTCIRDGIGMSKKRILVVDDSFIMRTIIKDIVDSDEDLEVVGFAENGKIGLQRVRELKPDAVLLDLEMPE